jgi:DHA1 family bicyclomycin/chloramphenicol resistance-like MFS transporter
MIRDHRALTVSSWTSMLFLGLAIALVGAAAKDIGLSGEEVGWLLTAQHTGFAVSVVVAGLLADALDKARMLLVGSLVTAAALLAFWATPSLAFNLSVLAVLGIGIGIYEVVTDALLLDLHPVRSGRHISINHFFVTLGATAITGWLLLDPVAWRGSVVRSGLVVLALAAFFALARAPSPKAVPGLWTRLSSVPAKRTVALLFVAAVLAIGLELGTMGFLATFLVDVRGATPAEGKVALVVFLVGIAAGRLTTGLAVAERRVPIVLLVLFALASVAFTALFSVDLGEWTLVAVFIAGFATSALFPLLVARAATLSPTASGAVVGGMKLAIPLGGALVAAIVSAIAARATLSSALLVIPACGLAGLGVAAVALRPARWPNTPTT